MATLIENLASAKGVASEYLDAWGQPAAISGANKRAMLAAMGYAVNDETALRSQLEAEFRAQWQRVLDPVSVLREGRDLQLEVRLPIGLVNDALCWTLLLEDGGKRTGTLVPVDGEMVAVAHFEEEFQAYRVVVKGDFPLGYHQFELWQPALAEPIGQMRLIVAPLACYKPEAIARGRKVWGSSIQLYGVRSQRNWGVGDFTDLSSVVRTLARWGADFVGLNPIHALYPANPESASPYSPSSRRWLNVIYIDVEAVPEFQACAEVVAEVQSAEFQARLQLQRHAEWVDYSAVTATKLQILRKVFSGNRPAPNSGRGKALRRFIAEGGDSLRQQAVYDALQASLYAQGQPAWGWPVWPEQYREFHSADVQAWAAAHAEDVEFYSYLQFLADEQLSAVDQQAKQAGMVLGLYRDLAVGVAEGASEIWGNRDLYCQGASVGAPPDILGPQGQNWGLPPMHPGKLEAEAYQSIIELFRANMRACGALRIDHVLGLLRLWWVPKGESAEKGAYVYYQVEDLLGILALESVRNQCLVIGEDLGTLPEGIDTLLREHGVHSYRVFFFERSHSDGGFISPALYPEQAMAALTTHDMPTLWGYWDGKDLALGQSLGIYSAEQLPGLYAERQQTKQRILDSLHGHGVLPSSISRQVDQVPMSRELGHDMQVHMCLGNSALFSTQLEDWLEMDAPVNVPGTSSEYPNWRRKLSRDLETMVEDSDLNQLARRMSEARKKVSHG